MAHHLLAYLRMGVMASPAEYERLQEHTVTVWFGDDGVPGAGLPPRRADSQVRDRLLEYLSSLDPTRLDKHFQNVAGTSGSGTSLQRLDRLRPGTNFYAECGFELALAYSTQHSSPDVWDEIARVAMSHDYPGVDRLLISVAAPVAPLGEVSPGDHVLWSLASEAEPSWPRPPALQHVEKVFVHDWWDGSIRQVFPESEEISPSQRFSPSFPVRRSRAEDVMGWSPSPR